VTTRTFHQPQIATSEDVDQSVDEFLMHATVIVVVWLPRSPQLSVTKIAGGVTGRSPNRRASDLASTAYRDTSVWRRRSKLVDGTDLPHARLHDLRHIHATTLLLAGVPVHVVAARLGQDIFARATASG
jgi:integrase